MKRLVLAIAVALLLPAPASATWSILAIDRETGRVVIASATCAASGPDQLKLVQAMVIPGVGVGANQSSVDNSQRNHKVMYDAMLKGTDPAEIIRLMEVTDGNVESRQIGIVDVRGRAAGRSGRSNSSVALDLQGQSRDGRIVFSVQGNIIATPEVLAEAAQAMRESEGDVVDRVMAAMVVASDLGGDRRCTCDNVGGALEGFPCNSRSSSTAYILAADPGDAQGTLAAGHPLVPDRPEGTPNDLRAPWNDGDYFLYLAVYPSNTQPGEDANPVHNLRVRFDAWVADGRPRRNTAVPAPTP